MEVEQLGADRLIIAGPCALESRQQLQCCVVKLKKLGITIVRASLWKPRTLPGWDGMGWISLPMLLEETLPNGLVPATEIITAEHAQFVVHALEHYGPDARILVWLGSRNQNHIEQKKIAKILAGGQEGILLMFKNQMWDDEKHWLGIGQHLLAAGFPKERLMTCHRGFSPGKMPNPNGYRNLPDFDMAMRVREKLGLKMILDPSHIGGTPENVALVVAASTAYDFDGVMIEVHCDPVHARTDAQQQLTPQQFEEILITLRGPVCHGHQEIA